MKRLYAVRGAVCAENTKESISIATVEMCKAIFEKNKICAEDIVSINFTLTKDLDEANPCFCLRNAYKGIDVSKVPLFCSQEAYIKGGLEKVIRVMVTSYFEESFSPVNVYTGGAEKLRPDFVSAAK